MKMSSNESERQIITTTITQCNETDDNIDIKDNKDNNDNIDDINHINESDSSDSDEELDYLSPYSGNCDASVHILAKDVIKDLFISNKLNKYEIIQRSASAKSAIKVEHIILTDNKIDSKQIIEKFNNNNNNSNNNSNNNNNNIFESKSQVIENDRNESKGIYNKKKGNKTYSKSDVRIEVIPKSFDDFLKIIIQLNASLIEDQNSRLFFGEKSEYRVIQYKDNNSYARAFIPFIFRELWNSLKNSRKSQLNRNLMKYKVISENEIKCSDIRKDYRNECEYKFGQIVILKYLNDENVFAKKPLFGIVRSVDSQLKNKRIDDELSSSPTRLGCEEALYILDFITIYCDPLAPNCDKVSIMPLTCVQNYLLEARIVYDLKKFPQIYEQILRPIFTFGVSGISINMESRKGFKFFDDQLDSIQKAYEVCLTPDSEYSNFVAIYGPKRTGKTEVMRETILQLLKLGETKTNKLLVISQNIDEINSIVEQLKNHKIKVFHICSEKNNISLNNKDIRDQVIKLNKELSLEKINGKDSESYEQCLKFYKEEILLKDMSTKDMFVKEEIEKLVINRMIIESEVIIGSIDSICNSEPFNSIYNFVNTNVIECVLIDNASLYTEPEMLTLLYAGVKAFVMFGDIVVNPKCFENRESFLQRYIRLYNNSKYNDSKSKSTSVVKLRDSIESRKRYQQNFKYRDNQRINFVQNNSFKNNRSYGKNYNQRYYSSHGFNKFSYNKNKNFDNRERKSSFNNGGQRLGYSNSERKPVPNAIPYELSQSNSYGSEYYKRNANKFAPILPQSASQSTPNPAYGNRESYLNQSSIPAFDTNYNQLNNNSMATPTYGNRDHYYRPPTNPQFTANPSQNANQSYFK